MESLESRCLLSMTPPALLDVSTLTIDPTSYDDSSILVRFDQAALATNGTSKLLAGQQLLPGASIGRSLALVPGLHQVNLSDGLDVVSAIMALQDHPWVAYAEPDFRVYATATPNDPRFDELWGLDNVGQTGGTNDADIDALGAWDIHTGTGNTVVAVIDTGVDWSHPDLAQNMWVNQFEANGLAGVDDDNNGYVDDIHGYDFINHDGNPMDDNGHGTHVAGTIGAVGNNGVGISGVNWDVQIMALKFLGPDGSGSGSDAIEALEYAVANGAAISNNSYGGDPFSQIFLDAIEAAEAEGHLFVAAAGNGNIFGIGLNNDVTPFYPSGYEVENVLAVAAVDHNDQLALFSNYGETSVDVAAPGVNILSTQPGGGYQVLSGTSMASPHVAGLAALVWDANPGWTYNQVIDQIVNSVDVLPGLNGLVATGGRINAASALGNPEPPPPPPPPASLPHEDDFNDGTADSFVVRAGVWDVANNRFNVAPNASNDDAPLYAVLPFEQSLPANLEIQARLNADEGFVEVFGIVFSDFLTNAFVIFDYQDDDDFRFAGADMDNDQWTVGRYNAGTWTIDATASDTLNSAVNYNVRILIENEVNLTLEEGGEQKLTHQFSSPVTDGDLGLGTRNSSSHFDNLVVQEYIPPLPPAPLPVTEDFEDGLAELFDINSGTWTVESGRFRAQTPGGGDAVSTIRLAEPLPADLELNATLFAESSGVQQNGFVIFDYQGPTDFKYAGAFVGTNRWAIGHRTSTSWVDDQTFSQIINAATDYDLQLVIQDDHDVSLRVGGVEMVTHTFADSVTDGKLGLAARSATSQFDDVLVQDFVPPPPPPPVTLPVSEDFDDGVADLFTVHAGSWTVNTGQYRGAPVAGSDVISTLGITGTLPADLEVLTTMRAEAVGVQQNGFVIFDYQSPTDFKYAGAFVGTNRWAIGQRTAAGWVDAQTFNQTVLANTDYGLQVVIQNDQDVHLRVDGIELITHTFADAVTDGAIGLAARSATSRFDNVVVQEFVSVPPPPVSLPVSEDFEDGVADLFAVQVGSWDVNAGRYHAAPIAGSNAVSTIGLTEPLPADLEMRATFQAVGGVSQNGFVVFDYQGPTEFKYAGAFVGTDRWAIGNRTSTGWVDDQTFSQSIDAGTDYELQLVIQNDRDVSLRVDGTEVVTFSYSDDVTDGGLGLATRNARSQFDDVLVQEFEPSPPPPPVTLPIDENFDDGTAELFVVQSGNWTLQAGRYHASPITGSDAISTLGLTGPLPTDLQMQAILNAEPIGVQQNGFVIFDYQSPTDFKFAGAFVGTNKWSIGHRTPTSWVKDVVFNQTINTSTDYFVEVVVQNATEVSLSINGVTLGIHTFSDAVNDGAIGLGTRQASSQFDDVLVETLGSSSAQSVATVLPAAPRLTVPREGSASAGPVIVDAPIVRLSSADRDVLANVLRLRVGRNRPSPAVSSSAVDVVFAEPQGMEVGILEDVLEGLVN